MYEEGSSTLPCVLHFTFIVSTGLHLVSKIITSNQIYQLNFLLIFHHRNIFCLSFPRHIYYMEIIIRGDK